MKQQFDNETKQPLTLASLPPFPLPQAQFITQQVTQQYSMPQSTQLQLPNDLQSELDFVNQILDQDLKASSSDSTVWNTQSANHHPFSPPSSTFVDTPPPSLPNPSHFPATHRQSYVPQAVPLSSSCPPVPVVATQGQPKDRRRKDSHNQVERRRRYNINNQIQELGSLIQSGTDKFPHLVPRNMKYSKGSILKASVDLMKAQQHQVDSLLEQNSQIQSRMAEKEHEIQQLKKSLETVQQVLQMHQIESSIVSLDFNSVPNSLATSSVFLGSANGSQGNYLSNDLNDNHIVHK